MAEKEQSITVRRIAEGNAVEAFEVVDNSTGKAVKFAVKETTDKNSGKTRVELKLGENSANRQWVNIARIDDEENEIKGTLVLGYKPSIVLGVKSGDSVLNSFISKSLMAYATPEEKAQLEAVAEGIANRYNEAHPNNKVATGKSKKAEMFEALAKKFGTTVEEIKAIVSAEKDNKEAK